MVKRGRKSVLEGRWREEERRGEKRHSGETRKLKKMAKLFHQRDGRVRSAYKDDTST